MDHMKALFDAALEARARAYAPYSKFRVGAALRAESGAIHCGCNVENAAYPVGCCAEAGAISAMILAGDSRITDIVIVGDGPEIVTPCGACLQRLHEFAGAEMKVHCADGAGVKTSYRMSDLLPHSFDARHIRNTSER